MEKNEHAILLDIPSGGKNGKYHSAILTTYAIDLIHFDNQLLNMLHRKQICSINVFADSHQMDKSMEYVSPIYMKNIGKDYSITSTSSIGAFHPKINFFVGDEAVLVVFGTGNLTVCGHGKNHEAFTGFMIDETNTCHRPLIEECWRYITQFAKQSGEFERNRIIKEVPENCTFLDSSFQITPHSMCKVQEGLNAALLYNDSKSSILQQITTIIPLNEVQSITILSPYFDEDGESLTTISQICPNASINILIHENCALPPCKLPENKRIVFYDFNETKRGKNTFKTFERLPHAKIFHFETHDSEYCMIGSANATTAGLGTLLNRGINDEFGVLYHSKDNDFLGLLGLKPKKKIDFSIRKLSRNNDGQSRTKNAINFTLTSAQYEGGKINISCNNAISEGIRLAIDNGVNVNIHDLEESKNGKYEVHLRLGKSQYICYLINNENTCVSNKIFLNWTELLANTNPSKTSRNLNRFISRIEDEGYEGLEIADMLSDIMWNIVNESEDNDSRPKGTSTDSPKIEAFLPELRYNPEYDNDEAKSHKTLQLDHTSKLIECIEESIRKKIRSIDDAITDEEESGNAETSNNRAVDEPQDIIISKKNIKSYGDLSTSVLSKYQKIIYKRLEQIRSTSNKGITKDDLNFFSLSIFAAIEICYLNRQRYQFNDINKNYQQKSFYDSLDRSICMVGIETIEKFVNFCTFAKEKTPVEKDYEKVAHRTMKYAILYGALFRKFSNQETLQILGNRVLKAIRTLSLILGMPTIDFLSEELNPLSSRYDYVFRLRHIEDILKKL